MDLGIIYVWNSMLYMDVVDVFHHGKMLLSLKIITSITCLVLFPFNHKCPVVSQRQDGDLVSKMIQESLSLWNRATTFLKEWKEGGKEGGKERGREALGLLSNWFCLVFLFVCFDCLVARLDSQWFINTIKIVLPRHSSLKILYIYAKDYVK